MLTELLPKPGGAHRIYLLFGVMILIAWGTLIAWQRSPYVELLGHEALADHHIPFVGHLSAFLLSWLLMTIAMMLPASLQSLIQTQRNRPGSGKSIIIRVAGYLSPWVLFGLLAFLGDSVLHGMTEPGAPLAAASNFIAPSILLAAGIYQLTPFKHTFTELCKPSMNAEFSERDQQVGGVLTHGFRLGRNCIGSCWSLMLLMFALGHHRLDWMLMISMITAAERLSPWGTRLAQWVGIGLVIWGVYQVIAII